MKAPAGRAVGRHRRPVRQRGGSEHAKIPTRFHRELELCGVRGHAGARQEIRRRELERSVGIHFGQAEPVILVVLAEGTAQENITIRPGQDRVHGVIRARLRCEARVQRAVGVQPGDSGARHAVERGEKPGDQEFPVRQADQVQHPVIGTEAHVERVVQGAVGVQPGHGSRAGGVTVDAAEVAADHDLVVRHHHDVGNQVQEDVTHRDLETRVACPREVKPHERVGDVRTGTADRAADQNAVVVPARNIPEERGWRHGVEGVVRRAVRQQDGDIGAVGSVEGAEATSDQDAVIREHLDRGDALVGPRAGGEGGIQRAVVQHARQMRARSAVEVLEITGEQNAVISLRRERPHPSIRTAAGIEAGVEFSAGLQPDQMVFQFTVVGAEQTARHQAARAVGDQGVNSLRGVRAGGSPTGGRRFVVVGDGHRDFRRTAHRQVDRVAERDLELAVTLKPGIVENLHDKRHGRLARGEGVRGLHRMKINPRDRCVGDRLNGHPRARLRRGSLQADEGDPDPLGNRHLRALKADDAVLGLALHDRQKADHCESRQPAGAV